MCKKKRSKNKYTGTLNVIEPDLHLNHNRSSLFVNKFVFQIQIKDIMQNEFLSSAASNGRTCWNSFDGSANCS